MVRMMTLTVIFTQDFNLFLNNDTKHDIRIMLCRFKKGQWKQ